MKRLFIQFLLTILSTNVAFGQNPIITFEKVTTEVAANNPFFGDFSAEIHDPGDTASVKVPVKKDLPDTMRMKGIFEFDGASIAEFDITLCEAFENEEFAKDLLSHGIPKDKFPKKCPAMTGMDYELHKYKFQPEKLPPNTPDGKFSGVISVYESDKDPYASVSFEGTISHKLPQAPGFGR
ncbi:uncharacterized protein LOC103573734 [Microplitis demolitor]|uniref:uncharacterized protein LOC103573734 n=1 Tax=Microplitis demolitor TaxID=69319 RepID=UPI0004CDA62B|nr:uncharacterized protein LOC103573734 [Microplitis demolitor]